MGTIGESSETAPTGMVATCLRLRRTPLGALGPGDLQLLISQKIGLEYLMAKAIQVVSELHFSKLSSIPAICCVRCSGLM